MFANMHAVALNLARVGEISKTAQLTAFVPLPLPREPAVKPSPAHPALKDKPPGMALFQELSYFVLSFQGHLKSYSITGHLVPLLASPYCYF